MEWEFKFSEFVIGYIAKCKNYIEFFFLMFMKKCVICNMEMTHSCDEQLAHCTGLQYR